MTKFSLVTLALLASACATDSIDDAKVELASLLLDLEDYQASIGRRGTSGLGVVLAGPEGAWTSSKEVRAQNDEWVNEADEDPNGDVMDNDASTDDVSVNDNDSRVTNQGSDPDNTEDTVDTVWTAALVQLMPTLQEEGCQPIGATLGKVDGTTFSGHVVNDHGDIKGKIEGQFAADFQQVKGTLAHEGFGYESLQFEGDLDGELLEAEIARTDVVLFAELLMDKENTLIIGLFAFCRG